MDRGNPNWKKGMKHPPRNLTVKKTVTMPRVRDMLLSLGVNPVKSLVEMLPELDVDQRIDVLKFLVSYSVSKPREEAVSPVIELDGEEEGLISDADVVARLESGLEPLEGLRIDSNDVGEG